ncbi:MAG: STAS domain-containing protein [Candidatus Kapaibacterium sp.]
MEVLDYKEERFRIIRVIGRIDTTTSDDFLSKVTVLINDENAVAMDFSELNYISSAGLRAVLSIAKEMNKRNGSFVIYSMGNAIRDIFDMAGFSSIINIANDKEEAVRIIENK